MNTPDTEMCICGEQECIGGAEVEIAGVCHRPNNPCYIIDITTPDTDVGGVVIDNSPRGRLISLFGAMNLDVAKPWVDEAIAEAISSRDTYWLKHEQDMYESLDKEYQLQVEHAKEERDTYWKEREAKKDDLLDDMWGLICNVNGGIVEDEKPDWYEAFFRIREKYFKQITPITNNR